MTTGMDVDHSQPAEAGHDEGAEPRRRRWAAALVAVVALALIAANIVLGLRNHQHQQQVEAATSAQREVGRSLVTLLSWKAATVLSDVQAEQKLLTGSFKSEYATLMRNQIGPAAQQAGLDADATIVAAATIEADASHATLLYFVNVAVSGATKSTKSTKSSPAPTGSRIKVTAVKQDGRWLIERYTPI